MKFQIILKFSDNFLFSYKFIYFHAAVPIFTHLGASFHAPGPFPPVLSHICLELGKIS